MPPKSSQPEKPIGPEKRKRRFFALFCVCAAMVAGFAVFEIVLRYGGVSDYDRNRPSWNPPERFREIDRRINEKNLEFSMSNQFGFNDRDRTEKKPEGIRFRIAVLGDSFIWGDGVPYDVIWSHKLEKLITAKRPDVEVLSWGKRGWSTKDELNFLKEYGIAFAPDLLIVGWVSNDPDVGAFRQKDLNLSLPFAPLHLLFPDTANALQARTESILSKSLFKGYGYSSWQDRLYTQENLALYDVVLAEFAQFCREKSLPVLFVLTPNNYAEYHGELFGKVKPFFGKNKIRHLDLFPAVCEKLKGRPFKELTANPANGHPGDPVTTVYADEVFKFVTKDPEISRLFQAHIKPSAK